LFGNEKALGWAELAERVTVSLGRGSFPFPLPCPTGPAFVPSLVSGGARPVSGVFLFSGIGVTEVIESITLGFLPGG
jgi:hypothetical protein